MHPELFELKALVAGRLDAHRRREIDDHLGSCADCSRHYVALMLGSSSPKTAEAEARQGLVPTGAGAIAAGPMPSATSFGIDAPIAPAEPRLATRQPHSNIPALETEFATSATRAPQPVSASLVDAIARLRAESDAPKPAAAPTPTPVATPQVVAAAPVETPLIEPSIFTPTPPDGVSIVQARTTPAASPELPGFMTRPVSSSPARSVEAQPELVVTFSSTPSRINSYRTPSTLGAVASTASFEYVSQAVPTTSSPRPTEFSIEETTVAKKPKPMIMGAVLGGAALVLVLGIAGYRYFQSSVSEAAAAAAAAAAKQVQAQAARNAAPPAPAAAAPATPAPVQTRIVYVREPNRSNRNNSDARQSSEVAPATTAAGPATPVSVTLPDVNVSTGAEGALQANTQRSATSELTRSARATATRTAAPRP